MKYKFKIIASLFIVLYFAILALIFNFDRELAIKDAKKEAYKTLETMNAIREYISQIQRPLIDELKQKGVLDKNFFDPRILSSSYITNEIYKIQLSKNSNYDYKIIAFNPLNPQNSGNEFENKILQGFINEDYDEYSKLIKDNGKTCVLVSLPIKNNLSCVNCHNSKIAPKRVLEKYGNFKDLKAKDGEIIAMIYSKIPVIYNLKEFIFNAIVMFIIFLVLLFFVFKIHQKATKIKEQNELLMIHQSRLASMGQMIENISHQWKTPLAQIGSNIVNLYLYNEKNKLTKEKLRQDLNEAQKQIKFMSNTIDDFKNFFDPKMPDRYFSSKETIVLACKILDDYFKKYQIDVKFEIKDDFTHYGKINEIAQILINILNNAKEAFDKISNREKIIKISSFVDENSKFITIENNAQNIDKKIIDRIFEPHFTTKNSGSGLGLYMSKVIMKKNNGEIFAKNLDEGVIFILKFHL